MKKLLLLTFCFIPTWVQAQSFKMLNLSYEGHPLDEYLIPSEDNKCLFHYLSETPVSTDWKIRILKSPNCLKTGYHQVEIINAEKQVQFQLSGFFIDGFFVGSTPLNTSVVKRYTHESGKQELFYAIEEDKDLKINYIGKATSSKLSGGNYPAFDACSPFSIILLTDRKELLSRPQTKENLLTVVKSYAQNICSKVKTIEIKATDDPTLTGKFYFEETLERKGNDWKSVNVPSRQKNISAKTEVKHTKPMFVVHVSTQGNNNFSFADHPFPIKINKSLSKGWWAIDGSLQDMDDFEKKKSGIGLHEKAGILSVKEAFSCSAEQCTDYPKK